MNFLRVEKVDLSNFGKRWALFLVWGIALLVLGALAISAATVTTMISVVFLGIVILIAGVVVTLDAFASWWGQWQGFALHLLMGILYLGAGYLMTTTPIVGSESLTLLLGVLYVLVGISRIGSASAISLPRWKWALFNGILTLLLGILILVDWPASSLFIIGLFVGIDLFFCGLSFLMMGLAAKAMNTRK